MTDTIQVENIQHSYQSSQEWMFQQLEVKENEKKKKAILQTLQASGNMSILKLMAV